MKYKQVIGIKQLFVLMVIAIGFTTCRPRQVEENSHFPPEVQIIFTNKCATAGCHNNKSYQNAANLNLTSWEALFKGSANGTDVIPFAPTQSSLLQFVNTYDDLGLKASPFMPLNGEPLSRNEVVIIRNWIKDGCPNSAGVIPFASNPDTRPKAYITNQGCDLVSVIDQESKMVMRIVKVGHEEGLIESPHNVKVSPDGKYWYVCFSTGAWLQKFDASSDTLISELNISAGKWNVIGMTSDGKTAFISDLSSTGRIANVDLQTMTLKGMYSSGLFSNPHGVAFTQTNDTAYVTAQYGNTIYRIIPAIPQVDNISLEKGKPSVLTNNLLDPHEITMSPDFSKYFVTCQASNELRVMDVKADTMLTSIPMGGYPLEMALSKNRNLLFVTCQEDANPIYPFFKGSVYVVDVNSMTVVHKIYEKFYQPHGIALDDQKGLLYVASTNANPTGPAPHHASECGGRNGYFHVIDLNTYKSVLSTSELSVFPYSVGVRQ